MRQLFVISDEMRDFDVAVILFGENIFAYLISRTLSDPVLE